MKKFLTILAVVMAVIAPYVSAYGAEPGTKIGYIDLQKILLESNEGRQAKAALEKQFASRKAELDAKKKELETMQKSLETQSAILSASALQEKQAEFVQKRDSFLQMVQKYEKELQEKDGELTKHIIGQLQGIIQGIGIRDHYTLILEKTQSGILYAPKDEDLTDRVMKLFNEQTAKAKK